METSPREAPAWTLTNTPRLSSAGFTDAIITANFFLSPAHEELQVTRHH